MIVDRAGGGQSPASSRPGGSGHRSPKGANAGRAAGRAKGRGLGRPQGSAKTSQPISSRLAARRNSTESRLLREFGRVPSISANGCWVLLGVAEGLEGDWRTAVELQGMVGPKGDPGAFLESVKSLNRWAAPQAMKRWIRICECLTSIHRIRILVKLFEGPATYQSLCRTTKLKSGPLYHHVGILRTAGMVTPKERDLYELTGGGRNLLLASMALSKIVGDRRTRIVPLVNQQIGRRKSQIPTPHRPNIKVR